jgi:hypothetical protein
VCGETLVIATVDEENDKAEHCVLVKGRPTHRWCAGAGAGAGPAAPARRYAEQRAAPTLMPADDFKKLLSEVDFGLLESLVAAGPPAGPPAAAAAPSFRIVNRKKRKR